GVAKAFRCSRRSDNDGATDNDLPGRRSGERSLRRTRHPCNASFILHKLQHIWRHPTTYFNAWDAAAYRRIPSKSGIVAINNRTVRANWTTYDKNPRMVAPTR